MWECKKCHEQLEDSFEVCWRCSTPSDGTEEALTEASKSRSAGSLVCPKCGSHDLIPDVRIVDRGDGNVRRDLQVEVYESPDALIFKGTHAGSLSVSICGQCGYAELYVSNSAELLEVYRQNKTE